MTQPNSPVLNGTDLVRLFEEAQAAFLKSISEEEKSAFSTCRSPDEFLQSAQKFVVLAKGKGKGRVVMRKIQTFADKLSPFFKIIDIFCSTHPEWANIAWGALRLVLQLASNFGTFFDTLCETLDQLAADFPRFTEVYDSLSRGGSPFSQRLPEALVKFYACIFDFFHSISRVFTRKDGRLKRTPVYVASIMWQPFHTRFHDVLNKMKSCKKVVQKELDLAFLVLMESKTRDGAIKVEKGLQDINKIYEEILDIKSSFDEAAKEQFDQKLNLWLSPPSYKSPLENAADAKLEGTAEWIFKEPIFQTWDRKINTSSESDGSMLWVHGNPGSGKTVLAGSVIDFLLEISAEDRADARVVCYFFFDGVGPSPGTRLDAYRAFATQLYRQCHNLEQIRDIFAFAARGPQEPSSTNELLDVLCLCLSLLPNVYLIVDGVDECKEDTRFVVDMCRLCEVSRTRVALFSRPTVAAMRQIKSPIRSISMRGPKMDSDIAVYFRQELGNLAALNLLPRHVVDGNLSALVRHLGNRADGMFLWARLMVVYLNSPALTPRQRLAILQRETPEGISDLYGRIFSIIKSQDKPSQLLARQVFIWCTHAYDQPTAQQLRDIVLNRNLGSEPDDLQMDIDHAVVMSCRGIIERRPDGRFRFIHATAKDFLASHIIISPAGVNFTPSPWEASCEITDACLRYLIFAIPLQPLSGHVAKSAAVDDLRATYPFLEYASLNWPYHLRESAEKALDEWSRSTQIMSICVCLQRLKRFLTLKHNIMLWIESFYSFPRGRADGEFGEMRPCIGALKAAASVLEQLSATCAAVSSATGSLPRDLEEFAKDIFELDTTWRVALRGRPQEIWGDVTLFTRSRFLVTTSAASVECLSADGPSEKMKGKARFSVSETSSDGQRMAVLSIWPSEPFEMFWTRTKEFQAAVAERYQQYDLLNLPETERDQILSSTLSSGWKATYDIYKIGDSTNRLCTITIPLKKDDIAIQLRQSLRGGWGWWKSNFPLAISSSLSVISILRSIYTARLEPSSDRLTVTLSAPETLNVGYIDPDACYWSERRHFFELPYLYNIKIGCDDKFVVFQDEDLGFRASGECSMTVFSLHIQQGEPRVQFLKRLPYRLSMAGGNLCVLHNRHPRLLFAASDKLYMWDLQDGITPPVAAHVVPDDIDGVGFSDCGEYFTIKRLGHPWPSVLPLPPVSRGKRSRELYGEESTEFAVEEGRSKRQRHDELQTTQESAVLISETPRITTLGGTHTLLLDKGATSTGAQSLELRKWQGNSDDVARLLSLPATIDMRAARPSVWLPGSHEGEAVVVLNRQQPFSYVSDDNSDQQLPILVRRDMKSLVFCKQKYIENGATGHYLRDN